MTDLRDRMLIYDQAPVPDYWSEVELRASATPEAARPGRSARPALLLVAVLLVILTISGAVAVGSGVVELPWLDESTLPPSDWSGPVRTEDGEPVVEPMVLREDGTWTWDEPQEALPGWLDVIRLSVSPDGQVQWYLELADWPPTEADAADAIIGHGLVLDGTGDGTADYVIGIDNDVPQPGDFHVWVTDLAAGTTEEQIGPPYGYPVEFSHPAEGVPDLESTVLFTFLSGTPRGVDIGLMRWYAWASATVAGDVVAWDYAPDTAWVGPPLGTDPTSGLPDLGMPRTVASQAGRYGTTVVPNGRPWSAGMHNVVQDGPGFRQTAITFAARDDCFAGGTGTESVLVTIAGQSGLYVEPYDDPSVLFGGPRDGVTTGAYAMPFGDRTLCVYLSWDPATTPDELDAARQVVESIRGQPVGENGIRINFTLEQGWDTG